MVPHLYVIGAPESPNLTPFCSTTSRFLVTGYFETSAPNDPNMTLKNTKRSKIPNLYATSISRVPKFTQFCSTTSRFRVTGHFETSAPNDPKWHWTLTGQRSPVYTLQVPPNPKFPSASLDGQPFSSYRPFWETCTEWPQNDIIKASYMFQVPPNPKFQSVSLDGKPFSSYKPF